jgi:protein-L-isoaspartate(D-aspartate) O-methyltransferase
MFVNPARARARMVEQQLVRRGISDPRVLAAFRATPREAFLPPGLAVFAYRDAAIAIGAGQTISQPYIVALTVQALCLDGHERVLEIGTGSGYAAAVLGRLAREVFTVERIEALAEAARARLARLGHGNITVLCGDGTMGWPQHAPYDAIAVAAGGPEIPRALTGQLAPAGRLVIPVGDDRSSQALLRITRQPDGTLGQETLAAVRFVPLIGQQGWPQQDEQAPGGGRAKIAQ